MCPNEPHSNMPCNNGTCGPCWPGMTDCGGDRGCTHTQTDDPTNCGGCGITCGGDTPVCVNGVCFDIPSAECRSRWPSWISCPARRPGFPAVCTDPLQDFYNCGGCGNECPEDAGGCMDGMCVPEGSCPRGMTKCGDRCVDLMTNDLFCGSCYNQCQSGSSCIDGLCIEVCIAGGCPEGMVFCRDTGLCIPEDSNNCGGCNVMCAGGYACSSGSCVTGNSGQR